MTLSVSLSAAPAPPAGPPGLEAGPASVAPRRLKMAIAVRCARLRMDGGGTGVRCESHSIRSCCLAIEAGGRESGTGGPRSEEPRGRVRFPIAGRDFGLSAATLFPLIVGLLPRLHTCHSTHPLAHRYNGRRSPRPSGLHGIGAASWRFRVKLVEQEQGRQSQRLLALLLLLTA